MEKEVINKMNDEAIEKGYELLSLAADRKVITVRDDQFGFYWLLDSAKRCRKKHSFRLIDSGKLDLLQLQELAAAGVDFYTSDKVRQDSEELESICKAFKQGKGIIAFFIHGTFETEEKPDSLSFSDLMALGRKGIYLHISNREEERSLSKLNQLAQSCKKGRSWLVYYHHGTLDQQENNIDHNDNLDHHDELEPSLKELGGKRCWIHVADKSVEGIEDTELLLAVTKSARSAGTNLVYYVEKPLDIISLARIIKAGAIVLFKFSLFDFESPLRYLERKARKKKLDFRASYLSSIFPL